MNCAILANSFEHVTKPSDVESSSAASISSRMQNGLGLTFKDTEDQGNGRQGLLAAGKQTDILRFFPGDAR